MGNYFSSFPTPHRILWIVHTSKRLIFTITTVLLISACSPKQPTPEQIGKAHYGIIPNDYVEQIKKFTEKSLLDPYSAVFEFVDEPSQGYWNDNPFSGGKVLGFGYWVQFTLNAKNKLGGYTGAKRYKAFITDGKVVCVTHIYEDSNVCIVYSK